MREGQDGVPQRSPSLLLNIASLGEGGKTVAQGEAETVEEKGEGG
jgi:hypothetical protein